MSQPSDSHPVAGEDDVLDESDSAILDRLDHLLRVLNPPPPDLDRLVCFALDLERVDAEVAVLHRLLDVAGARGSQRRTVTFDTESLTVMLVLTPRGSTVRVDGWLAPGEPLRVQLRLLPRSEYPPSRSLDVTAESDGRFVLEDVPHGLAQVVVHREEGDRPGTPVVTTAFEL
ncbi:MAG: hypothetical protein ACJ73E_17495 [Mycobacteriales bacterium]